MYDTFQIGDKVRNRNSGNTGTVVALPYQGCDWLTVEALTRTGERTFRKWSIRNLESNINSSPNYSDMTTLHLEFDINLTGKAEEAYRENKDKITNHILSNFPDEDDEFGISLSNTKLTERPISSCMWCDSDCICATTDCRCYFLAGNRQEECMNYGDGTNGYETN